MTCLFDQTFGDLPPSMSPHTLRHSFALAYIENGGNPLSLQRILGHTNQETTSEYVNMARSNVKAEHSKYSPSQQVTYVTGEI